MGAAAARPKAVVDQRTTVDLRAAALADVRVLVEQWRETGPLGLVPEVFAVICGLADEGQELFDRFDTDKNGKVDALEVICTLVALCRGTREEKLQVLFPVFDFAAQGGLSCNDAHIFLHSLLRGVLKVVGDEPGVPPGPQPGSPELEREVCEVCERLFDSYNLPASAFVSQQQVARWLSVDVEAQSFCDRILDCLVAPDAQQRLEELEQQQAAAFAQLCQPDGSCVLTRKLGFAAMQPCFGPRLPELIECLEKQRTLAGRPTDQVPAELFTSAGRAHAVFSLVTSGAAVPARDARTLLRLFHGQPPSDDQVGALVAPPGAPVLETVHWQAWVEHMITQQP